MTNDQAKTKGCPLFIAAAIGVAPASPDLSHTNCIGDVCVFWRYYTPNAGASTQGYCGEAGSSDGQNS